jgi:DNA-directed RNA polymerase specialized sigma24 family protein
MDRPMEGPIPPAAGLFTSLGGALFRRASSLLGDEAAAIKAVEELFVRFVVHGQAAELDARARWLWIYRVATNHCLRQLPDDAWPGGNPGAASAAPSPGSMSTMALPAGVPELRVLRQLDEATQNIVVLATLDGLTPDEISEVLGLPAKLVRRRLAARVREGNRDQPAPEVSPAHPSLLALDRDRSSHAGHLADCGRCRGIVEEADRLTDRFGREIAPVVVARVTAALRTERARRASGPRWKRALWLGGGLVLVSALALLVARPRRPDLADVPYAGIKGASRVKASGIQIAVRRDEEVRPLDPGAALRPGDRLHFRVRAERPRYLELRVRGAGGDTRVFPDSGTEAVLVRPGQSLDRDYVVGVGWPGEKPSKSLWIVGLFADHAFALDHPPAPDVEVVPVRVDIEN